MTRLTCQSGQDGQGESCLSFNLILSGFCLMNGSQHVDDSSLFNRWSLVLSHKLDLLSTEYWLLSLLLFLSLTASGMPSIV